MKINGITVKEPHSFEIEHYNISKSTRVATGRMSMDLIAKKLKFIISYETLSGKELDVILSLIDSTNMFFELDYVDNGITKKATVYSGPIRRKKFRTDGVWIWKNVTFNLIEQ